ncbi:MAG: amidase family protein, partial [Chloroflexota bacterium]
MELYTLTITEASAKLRAGEITSEQLTQAMLSRIAAYNPALNAYLTVTADLALEQARTADERIKNGSASPLT